MSDTNQAKNLLKIAQRDVRALSGMLNADTFADEIFGFHVQQAVEKLLKAWLAALGEVYPLTHNLILLLQILEDLGCDVTEFYELSDFSPFAVILRYEEVSEEDSIERSHAIEQVGSLFLQVEAVIKSVEDEL